MKFDIVKLVFFLGLGLFFLNPGYAQKGIGTNEPNKSAALEVQASNKGLLIPRVDLVSLNQFSPMTGAAAEANSLMVYNQGNNLPKGFYYWSAADSKWNRLVISDELQVASGDEIWYNQEDIGNPATTNTQNIYQDGRVAINKDGGFNANVALDVSGAIRGGAPNLTVPVGVNSMAVGEDTRAIGLNSTAFGYKSEATGEGSFAAGGYGSYRGGISSGQASFAMGVYSLASGRASFAGGGDYYASAENNDSGGEAIALSSFAFGIRTKAEGEISTAFGMETRAKARDEFVLGKFNSITNGNSTFLNQTDPIFQVGIGLGSEDGSLRKNAMTILKDGRVGIGISGQNDDAKPTEMLDIGSGKVKVRDLPTTPGNPADKLVVVDSQGVLKSVDNTGGGALIPKFFYMPSLALPLTEAQVDLNNFELYISATETFSVNLHSIYHQQFNTPMVSNPGSNNTLPALLSNELNYHITYYDTAVFEQVTLSNTGILTYKIKPDAEVTAVSFMNVVFEVIGD